MPLTLEERNELVAKHLAAVRSKIDSALGAVTGGVDIQELAQILNDYARTAPIPPEAKPTLWGQILNVPGILWISAALAVTFGLLSVWPQPSAALSDIAKVFAGAIVGAAGAGGVSPLGGRRG